MDDPPPTKKSRDKDLQQYLKEQPSCRDSTVPPSAMLNAVKKQMASFDLGGKRPNLLEKLYQALDSIPPTSTEGRFKPTMKPLF